MMNNISANNEIMSILAIVFIAFLVSAHFYINRKKLLLKLMLKITNDSIAEPVVSFSIEKVTGFILFGVIPFIIFIDFLGLSPVRAGFTTGKSAGFWYLFAAMPLFSALMSWLSSKNSKNWKFSPQMRLTEWHPRHFFISASGWFIYLLGYEFLLRGLLWFLCIAAFGFWPALLINVSIYSIIHIPKGLILTLGTIPVGILFCLLTWLTGSFYLAFLTHVTISVTNEIFSVINNPELRIRFGTGRAEY
jgi:membrane protease YdiL (CAAX protease family)